MIPITLRKRLYTASVQFTRDDESIGAVTFDLTVPAFSDKGSISTFVLESAAAAVQVKPGSCVILNLTRLD